MNRQVYIGTLVRDQVSGRARGLASVAMRKDEQAQTTAVRDLDMGLTRGAVGKTAPPFNPAGRRPERLGIPSVGRIATLFIGQSHGFIRLANRRDIFFHRSDVRAGVSFNKFATGDSVTFELIEDQVSGPRAVQVQLQRPLR